MAPNARLIAGVMSGTSLDGIDVALVRLAGSGRELQWECLHSSTLPFDEPLRGRLLQAARSRSVSVDALVRLNVRVTMAFAEAVRSVAAEAGVALEDLDAVGCHGQTVRHLPEPVDVEGRLVAATAQLGSGPVLANLLRVTAVTDFRSADMAVGGQGAPLVPYVDWVLFSAPEKVVGALNVGGIANVTVLRGTDRDQVSAFDTGPGNMLIDALAQRLFGRPFDDDGAIAASGSVHRALLDGLKAHRYFAQTPPKSTGREMFGEEYAARMVAHPDSQGVSPQDLIATATALTAETIAEALRPAGVQRVFVSGGGARNSCMMGLLSLALPAVEWVSSAQAGVDSDGKEAFAFAVLAHEALNGVPTGLPRVTGASRSVIQGSISLSV